jgi:hypothetical protein
MDKIMTGLHIESYGIDVEYGKIPSGLLEGWDGIVYYFKTNYAYDTKLHEEVVSKVVDQLESQSYDHGSEWRKTKIEALVWEELCQITLVSFRIKDSY